MPKVGKMKFPYTEQGMKEAQKYSEDSGKPMEVESYQYGGRVPFGMGRRPRRNPWGMRQRQGLRRSPWGMGRRQGGGMNQGVLRALMERLRGR